MLIDANKSNPDVANAGKTASEIAGIFKMKQMAPTPVLADSDEPKSIADTIADTAGVVMQPEGLILQEGIDANNEPVLRVFVALPEDVIAAANSGTDNDEAKGTVIDSENFFRSIKARVTKVKNFVRDNTAHVVGACNNVYRKHTSAPDGFAAAERIHAIATAPSSMANCSGFHNLCRKPLHLV